MSRLLPIFTVTFMVAFSSYCYELLLGTRLSFHLDEGIFVYPLTIAVFLLFMGLGAMARRNRVFAAANDNLASLLGIEARLVALGALSILLVDLLIAIEPSSIASPLVLGWSLSAWIGFLSGQELPLLFALAHSWGGGASEARSIIFCDYLAALFASLLFTLVLFRSLGLLATSFAVAGVNLLALVLLLRLQQQPTTTGSRLRFVAAAVGGAGLLVSIWFSPQLEDRLVGYTYALWPNDRLVARFRTSYQDVAIFIGRRDGLPIHRDISQDRAALSRCHIYGYLNRTQQFIDNLAAPRDAYHVYLADPALQMLSEARRVLILGGGDGLPAREVVQHPQVDEIVMVDIDGEWVEFTKTHPLMRAYTRDSLDDPRLQVVVMDAFKYVAHTEKEFDAVLVDFPEVDVSLAAIRTVSLQFLADLRRLLSAHGVAVIQSGQDIGTPTHYSQFVATAHAAGLYPLMGGKPTRSGHIVQALLFKSEKLRDDFFRQYTERYLEKHQDTVRQYSHLEYIDPKTFARWPDAERISFYDPRVAFAAIWRKIWHDVF